LTVCYFTGRKTVSGNNRSHAMNQTNITDVLAQHTFLYYQKT